MRGTALLASVGLLAGAPLLANARPTASAPRVSTTTVSTTAVSAAPAASARITAARASIARCADQASAQVRGLEALRTLCPGIGRAVAALDLGAYLPAHWQSEASAQALAGLGALAVRYEGPPPSSALATSIPALRRIALALAPPPPQPSWWQRLGRWIGARLSRWLAPVSVSPQSWLGRLRALLRPRVVLGLLAMLGGLAVMAIVLLLLRALKSSSDAYGRRRSRKAAIPSSAANECAAAATRSAGTAAAAVAAAAAAADTLDLASVARAGRREQPVLLLRLLVQALNASHRIGRERSLSCRELIAAGQFDSERQRDRFGRVALQAEHALYGGPHLEAALPECELGDAEALSAELLRPPAAALDRTAEGPVRA
ncbi:MAG: hypothetical protein ACREU3_12855 [Steroidobacteraceae bacterium]